jgi:hypothetical protein
VSRRRTKEPARYVACCVGGAGGYNNARSARLSSVSNTGTVRCTLLNAKFPAILNGGQTLSIQQPRANTTRSGFNVVMVRTKKHFRPPSSSSSSESSSEEEDDDDVLVDQQMMAQRGRGKQMIFGRGKQLPPSVAVAAPPPPRIEGRGKQLRA